MAIKSYKSVIKNLILYILLISLISGCASDEEKILQFYKAEIPLPEHPRPDFERDLWINLNGEWDFVPDSLDVGEMLLWHDTDSLFVDKITVPFSWASPLSGIGKNDFNVGWYARNILISKSGVWKDKRIFLVIGASDFTTTVWVNGKRIGEHEGGYTPFEFDITDHINKKGLDRIVIRAEDMPVPNRPVGKQVYGEAKGIWQTVYIEGRSEYYINRIYFTPDIDNEKVSVKVELNKACDEDLILSIAFKDNIVETVAETFPAGQDSLLFDIPIPDQRLWNPEDPFLYEVDVALDSVEKELDNLYSYFGMRKIGTGKLLDSENMYITLNNKPIYLKMALDRSYHPLGFYTFPTDNFMRDEILRAKDIGLNGLRIHLKTEIPRKLYWADKLGILIQSDIPSINGDPDDDAQKNWKYTANQQILRDYNHPSIFSWVLFNETWGIQTENINSVKVYLPKTREWVRSLYYWAKELDPTRLVEDNSPFNEDHVISEINSWHKYLPSRQWSSFLDYIVENTYPGSEWNYIGDNKQTDIPMMNSECGAVRGYEFGTGDIDISYEYHIMINEFRRRPKIAGFIFTEFHDVINEWNGYYRYDRSKKDFGLDELCPGMTINDFHSDMYIIPGKDFEQIVKPGSEFSIPITASFMVEKVPLEMTLKAVVHGWNRYGEHKQYSSGQFTLNPKPYKVFDLQPIKVSAPDEECLAVFCTYLIDDNGETVHHNFVPFRVMKEDSARVIPITDSLHVSKQKMFMRSETLDNKTIVLRESPNSFSNSEWSVKQKAIMDSMKVWGTGIGFFEYEFLLPEGLIINNVQEVEFLAELSSRSIQAKDMAEEDILRQGINKGIDPGYSPNSYPMTDETKHTSTVNITLNDIDAQTVVLQDDPADHRGLLSWFSQKSGTLTWRQIPDSFNWKLDEAGSHGYLVKITFSGEAVEKALKEGMFRIKLAVTESSDNSGGLAVYGEQFGRFPLDPTLIIRLK